MTTPTRTNTAQPPDRGGEDFTTSEGVRALLNRLAEGGEDAWVHDPVARDLMEFAADKYRALARKHKLDAWEAVTAAFDAMQYRSTREANDPWAIITHAVRITCVYEERAQGLLCSVHQARRAHVSAFHDPERFSERDTALADYHPAFHTTDMRPSDLEPEPRDGLGSAQACISAGSAAEDAIAMLCLLHWPTDTARAAVEHVCGALMKAGTRQSAYEALRRDRHARALLDLPRRSWSALLKALLGNPHPAYVATSSGRGVLLRLLLGETLDLLLRDDDLILALALAAPGGGGGESS
ncbi:hypothetical protein M3G43_08195 [Brevibacterium casei]|uniref:hypothetical protein n=2 Tax=Actinomycetes TaxID=1760 RepID=UPI00223B35B2|nr:hypothetical protein [Brevibacterium casei]MCT1447235.1 hypothetical protein [Brevibacterium casei]